MAQTGKDLLVCQSLVRDSLITRSNFVDPDRRVLTRLECNLKQDYNLKFQRAIFVRKEKRNDLILSYIKILTII